jgi:hypothetical protein
MKLGRAGLGSPALVLAMCIGGSVLLHAVALTRSWLEPRPNRPFVKQPGLRLTQRHGNPQTPRNAEAASTVATLRVGHAAVEPIVQSDLNALESAAPSPVPSAPLPTWVVWDAYVPRPLLSKPPQALDPVLLAWPNFEAEQSHFEAVAALYIDEAGVVQALRVKQGQLPEPLLQAARLAFEGRRFLPGELNGQAVKARIYVEIMFGQPEAVQSAARGLSK